MRPARPTTAGRPRLPHPRGRAFSLVELLIVIAIIGLLAAIGLPALRGLGESTGIDAATRQVLDDLAFARQQAINQRSEVFMIFIPPDLHRYQPEAQRRFLTNFTAQRLTTYALYARRTVGDQPGQATPRMLTPWRSLPDGVFFSPEWFVGQLVRTNPALWQFTAQLPRTNLFNVPVYYPPVRSNVVVPSVNLPYIRFTPRGQLLAPGPAGPAAPPGHHDVIVRLSKGSIFAASPIESPDVVETPKGYRRFIRVNGLTGRARVDHPPGAKEIIP